MIFDDNYQIDGKEEILSGDDQPKIMWYLIDRDGNFCKAWNFIITIITIY